MRVRATVILLSLLFSCAVIFSAVKENTCPLANDSRESQCAEETSVVVIVNSPKQENAVWKIYRNETYGFELEYPANYSVVEDTNFDHYPWKCYVAGVTFSPKPQDVADKYRYAPINIGIVQSDMSLKKWFKKYYKTIHPTPPLDEPDFVVQNIYYTKVSDAPAIHFWQPYCSGSEYCLLIKGKNNWIFNLTCIATRQEYDDMYHHMTGSFKLIQTSEKNK